MIFEPRSIENHEKIEFLVSLTISFMKILIFFLNSDFLPSAEIECPRKGYENNPTCNEETPEIRPFQAPK